MVFPFTKFAPQLGQKAAEALDKNNNAQAENASKTNNISHTEAANAQDSIGNEIHLLEQWKALLTEKLIGFEISEYPEFQQELENEFTKFALQVIRANAVAKDQEGVNNLQSLLAEFEPSQEEQSIAEIDTRTIDDFFIEFFQKHLKSLDDFFYPICSQIEDGNKYVVTSKDMYSAKAKGKIKNASKSYAHEPQDDYPGDFISGLQVLFDTTSFGSAKDGLVITDYFISWKPMFEDPEYFPIEKINRVRWDEDEKEIMINGNRFGYYHSELNKPAKLCVAALKQYIEQPALALKKHFTEK